MKDKPEHSLAEFESACADHIVIVLAGPERDALVDFGLRTKGALLDFIGNGGIETPSFVNCLEWRLSKIPGRWVDGYQFYNGNKPGYVAFTFCVSMSKWY